MTTPSEAPRSTLPGSTIPGSDTWIWRGERVHYVHQGTGSVAILLVHGFGASTDHWRHNIPVLANHYQVFAIDLLGFGRSAKPNWIYRTEVWRDQLRDFCQQVVRKPVVVVGNSLGGYVALSLAADWSEWTRGVVLLNSAGSFSSPKSSGSPSAGRAFVTTLLQSKPFGYLLFHYLRQPAVIRGYLKKLYVDPKAVTDQLVQDIHLPSCDPGAADVFVNLMQGGQKGRPVEDLLRSLVRPLLLIWGEGDPWMNVKERSKLYRSYYYQLEEHFLTAGHCPHDEQPAAVNQLIQAWIESTVLRSVEPHLP